VRRKQNFVCRHCKQEGAAVEGLPAIGPSLQLNTCVLPQGDSKCCHLVNHLDLTTLRGERALVVVDFLPTTQLAAVTLTSDPLTLKLVHGVLVSQGPFLRSLVFVSLFVFPLGGGTGQTDGRTDRRTGSIYMMGPPFRKNGPIISSTRVILTFSLVTAPTTAGAMMLTIVPNRLVTPISVPTRVNFKQRLLAH